MSMITFATYPDPIFQGALRIVLFTAIPAGFINSMPVTVLRYLHPGFTALTALFAIGINAVALWLWRLGLRR